MRATSWRHFWVFLETRMQRFTANNICFFIRSQRNEKLKIKHICRIPISYPSLFGLGFSTFILVLDGLPTSQGFFADALTIDTALPIPDKTFITYAALCCGSKAWNSPGSTWRRIATGREAVLARGWCIVHSFGAGEDWKWVNYKLLVISRNGRLQNVF